MFCQQTAEVTRVEIAKGVLQFVFGHLSDSSTKLSALLRKPCKVTVTDDWIDAEGNYYPDSVVQMDANSLFNGTAAGIAVHRATALYTHSKDLISVPRWMLTGETAPRALLFHEMAHAAANEPDTDHRPQWHKEMNRLWKAQAPINLHDVTLGFTGHELVTKYGVGTEFWEGL